MALKNKSILFLAIIILVAVLGWFAYDFYTDKQLVNQLPVVPSVSEQEVSLKNNISESLIKIKKDASSENIGALGMVYHSNNYFNEAEKCYELAIKDNPKAWEWSYYLGCLKRELGNSEETIVNFKKVLEANPKSYMALYYLGEAYQQLDSIYKAEQILMQLSQMDKSRFLYSNTKRTSYFPLPLYAKLQLTKLYVNDSRSDLAEKELKELIGNNITFGPAYRQLSNLYAQTGDEDLSQYYSDRSNDLNIYISPVDTLIDKLSLFSKSETYLLKQIDDAIRSSNSHWALELIGLGLESIPNSKYLISKAIKHYIDMNATKKALPLIDKHLEYFKENYQEIIEVGVGLANRGYKNEALKYFMAAEKMENEKVSAKATLAGMYYEKMGMKERGMLMIKTLIKKYPKNPEVISAGIFLFLQEKDFTNVKKYQAKLVKYTPNHKDINVFKGIIAQGEGDVKASVKFYEKALTDNPDKKFISNFLRDYYSKNKLWKKELQLYKTVLEHTPNDSDIQEAYGSLLLSCPDKSLRNINLAKEFSERAFINKVFTLPTRISAGRSLAISHFELGSHGKAIYYINKTVEIAKKAGATKAYVQELESILNDFRKIVG